MIQLTSVYKTYHGTAGDVPALKNVSISINSGETIMIIGKSGSGKSTLLNIVSGIDRPDSGEIQIGGELVHQMKEGELAKWRGRTVGVVFQSFQLIPTLAAIDNVVFAMDLVGVIRKGERRKRAVLLLEQVGLGEKLKKFPNELSGGEVQRVAIARALANNPPLLIADEPTGNLDSQTSDQIYELFASLKQMGKNLIIVTHEHIEKRNFDRVFVMKDGILEPTTI